MQEALLLVRQQGLEDDPEFPRRCPTHFGKVDQDHRTIIAWMEFQVQCPPASTTVPLEMQQPLIERFRITPTPSRSPENATSNETGTRGELRWITRGLAAALPLREIL